MISVKINLYKPRKKKIRKFEPRTPAEYSNFQFIKWFQNKPVVWQDVMNLILMM